MAVAISADDGGTVRASVRASGSLLDNLGRSPNTSAANSRQTGVSSPSAGS